ncbi:tetratricopeptide repeat protein [Oceanobacillus sojae]
MDSYINHFRLFGIGACICFLKKRQAEARVLYFLCFYTLWCYFSIN